MVAAEGEEFSNFDDSSSLENVSSKKLFLSLQYNLTLRIKPSTNPLASVCHLTVSHLPFAI